ncbi:hypothetical protein EXE58_18050 [Nocardioides seonyuensis]|uniref:Uncharacterized protein n=1 Tax=Nocardioides seonyuensis TaxID=2518371 RepID=A0A4V1BMQ0_9ACTN|nr:hypothetical protein [Nocardioides seonyuensis]QBX57142.1 hypothetical protein EXE58_18050 [Nocardioides seonyuensis]
MSAPDEPQDDVDAFWNLARFHAKLNPAPGYFGQTAMESVPPPTWSFDASSGEADDELEALLITGKASLSAPAEDYGDELPEVGTLAIVLDSDGRPRALVQTTEVTRAGDALVESFRVVYQPA